jgi:hypothetical protein
MKKIISSILLVYISMFVYAAEENASETEKAVEMQDIVSTENAAASKSPFFDIGFDITGAFETERSAGVNWSNNDIVRDVPFIPEAFPAFSVRISYPNPYTFKPTIHDIFYCGYFCGSSVSPVGITAYATGTVNITPLLTIAAGGQLGTAWNYGSLYTAIGVYDVSENKYRNLSAFGSLFCDFTVSAVLVIPLGPVIAEFIYVPEFVYLTGAGNGEAWKFSTQSECVNGWRYLYGGMIAYQFPKKTGMAGIQFIAQGWYLSNYFDEIFQPYDPDFVTFSIIPSFQIQITKKQGLQITVPVSRVRRFENENYTTNEILLQNCVGSVWRLVSVNFLWHIQIN